LLNSIAFIQQDLQEEREKQKFPMSLHPTMTSP